ncbi:MAG: hypothetical protein RIE56_12160, partial [Amphiplicatus sp.]
MTNGSETERAAEPSDDPYAQRPWRQAWPAAWRAEGDCRTLLEQFRDTVERRGGETALWYFDASFTWAELDALSDAFAAWL